MPSARTPLARAAHVGQAPLAEPSVVGGRRRRPPQFGLAALFWLTLFAAVNVGAAAYSTWWLLITLPVTFVASVWEYHRRAYPAEEFPLVCAQAFDGGRQVGQAAFCLTLFCSVTWSLWLAGRWSDALLAVLGALLFSTALGMAVVFYYSIIMSAALAIYYLWGWAIGQIPARPSQSALMRSNAVVSSDSSQQMTSDPSPASRAPSFRFSIKGMMLLTAVVAAHAAVARVEPSAIVVVAPLTLSVVAVETLRRLFAVSFMRALVGGILLGAVFYTITLGAADFGRYLNWFLLARQQQQQAGLWFLVRGAASSFLGWWTWYLFVGMGVMIGYGVMILARDTRSTRAVRQRLRERKAERER